MIVADTSALISLATGDVLDSTLDEFEVATTDVVVTELSETAEYDDTHGTAASRVLNRSDQLAVHESSDRVITSSRVDAGEGSCVGLCRCQAAAFLITDDLRAVPELRKLVDCRVAISPILLRGLVDRGALDREEARERLNRIAETRDWLGGPIFRRGQELLNASSDADSP